MSNRQHLKHHERHSRSNAANTSQDRLSLFPFFRSIIQHQTVGRFIAGIYAVTMLIIALIYHTVGDYNVETDFFWSYIPEAKSILQGTFIIEGFRGPAYPAILALVSTLLGDYFRAGILISVFAAAGTLFFAYEILRRIFRPDAALIGTLLIAVNGTFIQYSYTACTDMVFNFLITGSIYFFLRNEQRLWSNIFFSALLSALAYLTRYNGVFILAAAPIIILLVNPYKLTMKECLKTTGLFLGVFLAIITPWGIYCLIEKGSFFFNLNYLNIAYEMFAKEKMGWDHYWNVESKNFHSLAQVIFSDPEKFIRTILSNLYSHFTGDMKQLLRWQLGIVSVIGIFVFIKEKPTRQQSALLTFGTIFFAVLLLVFYGERFSMFLLLIYVALAIRALTWKRLSEIRLWNRVQIGALISWILIVWTFTEAYEFNRININSGPQEIPLIAEWFKNNHDKRTTEEQLVIARKPHIAYYLGMKWDLFPYVQNEEELRQQVKSSNASYLFFSMMEAYMRPEFRAFLNPQNSPTWLIPITYTVSPPAVLYKVDLEKIQ